MKAATQYGNGQMTEEKEKLILDEKDALAQYWDSPVAELATVKLDNCDEHEAERHKIYSLLLMALVTHFWNGNKRGMKPGYNWREKQRWEEKDLFLGGKFLGEDTGQYLGHNIACLAVDRDGDIIDFEFNHNEIFSSTVEHAESRLIRRLFSLTQLSDGWALDKNDDAGKFYSTLLRDVTIYTSLESCAQCAGIMALARVKQVVYLQRDYGMYSIGNILYNLTRGNKDNSADGQSGNPHMPAPTPIPARHFGFSYFEDLDREYRQYHKVVAEKPFYVSGNNIENRPSVTSFLCNDEAFAIYSKAAEEFERLPSLPAASDGARKGDKYKTNPEVITKAKQFLDFVKQRGRRGTPHRL